jgi:hypothetical protein
MKRASVFCAGSNGSYPNEAAASPHKTPTTRQLMSYSRDDLRVQIFFIVDSRAICIFDAGVSSTPAVPGSQRRWTMGNKTNPNQSSGSNQNSQQSGSQHKSGSQQSGQNSNQGSSKHGSGSDQKPGQQVQSSDHGSSKSGRGDQQR